MAPHWWHPCQRQHYEGGSKRSKAWQKAKGYERQDLVVSRRYLSMLSLAILFSFSFTSFLRVRSKHICTAIFIGWFQFWASDAFMDKERVRNQAPTHMESHKQKRRDKEEYSKRPHSLVFSLTRSCATSFLSYFSTLLILSTLFGAFKASLLFFLTLLPFLALFCWLLYFIAII